MKKEYFTWLKWGIPVGLVVSYAIITAFSSQMHWARSRSDRYQLVEKTISDAQGNLANTEQDLAVFVKNSINTTSSGKVVTFPICRNKYIDLSADGKYPIPHWVYSLPQSADKALILAIAKNESRFRPYVKSHAGAIGLMQLMPRTANYMIEKHGGMSVLQAKAQSIPMISTSSATPRTPFDFKDPFISLAIGNHYVGYLKKRSYIGNNTAYLLAAYNAGPGNLRKWARNFGDVSEEHFVKKIPYPETRNYVKKVLADYQRYRQLLPDTTIDAVWVDTGKC